MAKNTTSKKKKRKSTPRKKWSKKYYPPTHIKASSKDRDAGEVEDTLWTKKFPAPKKSFVFRKKWAEFIERVANRSDFNQWFLSQLEVLCDMYAKYEEYNDFITENGMTYETNGRYGLSHRSWPQAQELPRLRVEIRNYSRLLGLVVVAGDGRANNGKSGIAPDPDPVDNEGWE